MGSQPVTSVFENGGYSVFGFSGFAAPSYVFDASSGALPGGSTFTRASTATYVDFRGYLQEAAGDVPRYNYDPVLTYNEIVNPWGDGAVVGVPGTAPTGWALNTRAGITRSIVSSGIEDGIPYVDVRWQGTATEASPNPYETFRAHNPALIPAVQGDVFTSTVYFRLIAGSFAGLSTLTWRLRGYTTGLAVTGSNAFQNIMTVNDAPLASQRITVTNTLDSATAACVGGSLWAYWPNGTMLDFTLRIGFPVTNRGAASLLDTVPLAVLAARKGTVPQYGIQGLLLEEASTNVITNPRAEGATVGTPGTGPTGWTMPTDGWSVVGTGTESGIPYVDVRMLNPTVMTHVIVFDAPYAVVAAEVFTEAFYCRLIAGSLTNVTLQACLTWNNGTNVLKDFVPTNAPLITQRYNVTATVPETQILMRSHLRMPIAGACDFTLRIGFPQTEKNPFPTSVTLPVAGTPAVSTRARDALAVPLTYALSPGTFSIRAALARGGGTGFFAASLYLLNGTDAAGANGFNVTSEGGANTVSLIQRSGGTDVAVQTQASPSNDVFATGCMTWGNGSSLASWNGAVPIVDTTAPDPVAPITGLRFNASASGTSGGTNNIIRFLRIWNGVKLTAAQVKKESGRTT